MKILSVVISLLLLTSCVKAENTSFTSLKGEDVSFESIMALPRAVLFLWSSKCGACQAQLVALSRNCPDFKGTNIYFVNLGESQRGVEYFVEDFKLNHCISDNIFLDPTMFTARKFYVSLIPTVIYFKYGKPVLRLPFLNQEMIKKAYPDEQN